MANDFSGVAASAEEFIKRDRARKYLEYYVPYVFGFEPARHHRFICRKLDKVLDGKIKRLIVAAPPGHGKSIYTSHAFAAFYSAKAPKGSSIIACANTQKFADSWGYKVRNTCYSEEHLRLFPEGAISLDSSAKDKWSTVSGNEYMAAGVGATITGRRADLLLCDDLLKGTVEAKSKARRETIREWYFNDAKTRLKSQSEGVIIMINTRWHEDDLTGTLLEQMEDGTGEEWDYIKFPALSDGADLDLLGRPEGEALWPDKFPVKDLLKMKTGGMPRQDWNCLYQQDPKPTEGVDVKREWIQRYGNNRIKELLDGALIVMSIDTANSATDRANPSVILTGAITKNKDYVVLHVHREKLALPDLRIKVIELAKKAKTTWKSPTILIENKATGQSLASFLKNDLRGYSIILQDPKKFGDKEIRWERATPVIEGERFYIPSDNFEGMDVEWLEDYIDEIITFPLSKDDDQVDATSQFINWAESRSTTPIRMRRMRVG